MSNSNIFYSEVNPRVQAELNERARAGRYDRSTKSLQFMLEKIANVTAIAYQGNTLDSKDVVAIIGGKDVRGDAYLPKGFLSKERISKRIPPVITSTSISFTDGTMSMLNQAALTVQISTLEDLEQFERIWCRPGRKAKLDIEYPQSAVLTSNADTPINPTSTNTSKITDVNYVLEPQYLHKLSFVGLIISFDLTFNPDSTITAIINLKGTGSTYPDLNILQTTTINQTNSQSSSTGQSITAPTGSFNSDTFFTVLEKEAFEAQIKSLNDPSFDTSIRTVILKGQDPREVMTQILSTKNIVALLAKGGYNEGYLWGTSGNKYHVYVSLERLVNAINRYILIHLITPQSGKDIPLISMDAKRPKNTILDIGLIDSVLPPDDYTSCQCVHYPELVSSNPWNVLLWEGTNQSSKTCTYGEFRFFGDLREGRPFQFNGRSSAKQIYINLDVVKKLVLENLNQKKSYSVKNFLSEISKEIAAATADAINMVLIPHPEDQTVLLYYDMKFSGTEQDKNTVTPYQVPTYPNDPRGTIVRADGFKITSQLPPDLSSLAYTLSNGNISDSNIAPHIQYIYADENLKEQIKTDFKKNSTTAKQQLSTAKSSFGQDFYAANKMKELFSALSNYIKYPIDDIETASLLQGPVFPLDITFVIDGINGLRYSDILQFSALPSRYSTNAVFYITGVTHDVDSSGDWKTTVTCKMRPKL